MKINERNTPGVCGTAREAPTGSVSADPICATQSAPHQTPGADQPPPVPARRKLIDLRGAPSAMNDFYLRSLRG